MTTNSNLRSSLHHSKAGIFSAASLLAIACATLSGCGSTASTASGIPVAMSLQGSVLGGQQAIVGAQIELYAAGTSGTASSGKSLLPAPVQSASDGSFKIAGLYTCPSSDAQVYLVARGGSLASEAAARAQNSSRALMTMLGSCGSLSTPASVAVSEATTVASVFPLANYMVSPTHLGSVLDDASFAEAAASATQFVKQAAQDSAGMSDEAFKLRTLANVLVPCVHSNGASSGDGAACTRLFQTATTPGGAVPTDTITAALHIAQNPANDVAGVFNLASARGPYQPALSNSPQDWKLRSSATPASATTAGGASASSNLAANAATTTPAATKSGITPRTSASTPTAPATYYVANNGDDSNDGLSPAHPWKTIGKVNASTALFVPGTSILLNRGDVWRDDYINFQNKVIVTNTMTLASNPLAISGTPTSRIIVGAYGTGAYPLLDGADPLHLHWSQVVPGTWQATVSSLPSKLYADSPTAETVQLIPQANGLGAWDPTRSYKFLDLAVVNGQNVEQVTMAGSKPAPDPRTAGGFIGVDNFSGQGHTMQSFAADKPGLQNVEETPGSWYGTGNTIYVHLLDSSDPNAHTFEGSVRPFGVLMMSVNYVTVQNISVERTVKGAIVFGTFADSSRPGHYYTNEYNTVLNTKVWNWGDLGMTCLVQQNNCNGTGQAGILSKAFEDGLSNGEAIRGTVIWGNYVGISDHYFALRGMDLIGGIQLEGQNAGTIKYNRVITVNNQCINYSSHENVPRNINGEIGYNYCTKNQGNIFFSETSGGRIHDNAVAYSAGQGIQIGGNDANTVVDHNLIYYIDRHGSGVGYNGIDCNGGATNVTEANNTVYDTWGANITMEYGCTNMHLTNNVLSEGTGQGRFFWWVTQSSTGIVFRNNLYNKPAAAHPWGWGYVLATWRTFSGESDAQQVVAPTFVNEAKGDFRLVPGSPGTGASIAAPYTAAGTDQGANLVIPQ